MTETSKACPETSKACPETSKACPETSKACPESSPSVESSASVEQARKELNALGERIAKLSAHIQAATYLLLCMIRKFDDRKGWVEEGAKSCAEWLSWRTGLDLATAREKVRVATALPQLPAISEAFSRAELSYSKVRALTRIATPETDGELVDMARAATASQLEKVVRRYRRAEQLAAAEGEQQRESRTLHYHYDESGMLVLRARLPPEQGALVVKAIEAAMDSLSDQPEPAGGPDRRAVQALTGQPDVSAETSVTLVEADHVSAETSVTLVEADHVCAETSRAADLDPRQTSPRLADHVSAETSPSAVSMSQSTWPQRAADALALVAESALGCGLALGRRAERYQVMMHVDADVLADPQQARGRADVEGCGISAETARRLTCDVIEVPVHEGSAGAEPLVLGRRSRRVNAALQRALEARDQGCAFPGCTHHRHVHIHHVVHWANGGTTDPDNLVTLCSSHHRAVHEGGFSVQAAGHGHFVFATPHGRPLPASPAQPAGRVEALAEHLAAAGTQLDPSWCASTWDGRPVDYPWVVQAIWDMNHQEHMA